MPQSKKCAKYRQKMCQHYEVGKRTGALGNIDRMNVCLGQLSVGFFMCAERVNAEVFALRSVLL